MKATLIWLGGLLLIAASTSLAQAHPFCHSCGSQPQVAWGSGYAYPNWGGGNYGCNYCPQMPPQPYSGFLPGAGIPCQKVPGFPMHPYARSPRDFFMVD
jgi:hypothetical protein